jgi:hypothetical protein
LLLCSQRANSFVEFLSVGDTDAARLFLPDELLKLA